jgi:hypothetical protein
VVGRNGAVVSASPDGRAIVALPVCERVTAPLDAVLVPLRCEGAAPAVEWLSGARRLVALERFPRLAGWTDVGSSAVRFDRLARLADVVPVGVVTLPPGRVPDRSAAARLIEAIGAALDQRSVRKPGAWNATSSA